ncbi:hypothetical protein BJX65DRAFT_314820 [Aspergillus insuetus]
MSSHGSPHLQPDDADRLSLVAPLGPHTITTIEELCDELAGGEFDSKLAAGFFEGNKGHLEAICKNWGVLSRAAGNNTAHSEISKDLLLHAADPQTSDSKGRTALGYAAQYLEPDLISLLVKIGVPVNQKDASGRDGGLLGVMGFGTLLPTRRPLRNYDTGEGLLDMVKFIYDINGNGEKRKRHDVDVLAPDKNGRSPLSHAAEMQRDHIIVFLVECRDFHKDSDNEYRTPLHWLHRTDRHDNGRYKKQPLQNNLSGLLLEYFGFGNGCTFSKIPRFVDPEVAADTELMNRSVRNGKTLLSYAVLNDDDVLIKLLCGEVSGLRSDIPNEDDNETALMLALERASIFQSSVVLNKLVPRSDRDDALQRVIQFGRSDSLAKLLYWLKQGSKGLDTLNHTALETFFEHAPSDAAVALLGMMGKQLNLRPEINKKLASGRLPLEEARDRDRNSEELVQLLLENGADPKFWTQRADWDTGSAPPEHCLLRFERQPSQAHEGLAYSLACAPLEALGRAVAREKRTIFFAYRKEGSWQRRSSFLAPNDSSIQEIEIQFDALKNLRTCGGKRLKQASWGIRWIEKQNSPELLICESTLRKIWIPADTTDFLTEFLHDFEVSSGRPTYNSGEQRKMASGPRRQREKLFKRLLSLSVSSQDTADKDHVNKLGGDIYFLSRLRGVLQDQVRTIQQGLTKHFANSKEDPSPLENLLKEHRLYYNERLDRYEQVVNSLLQLEYTRHSVEEAKTIRLISYITFIYLPLMFTSSLFGMNVNVLRDNPGWYWYLPFAAVSLGLTLFTYVVYRYREQQKGGKWKFPWHLRQRKEGSLKGEPNV